MGSITLSRNGTSVTLSEDLSVSRGAGRENAEVRATPGADRGEYYDNGKPASDVFEIAAELTGPNAESTAATLQEDIILPPLGTDTLTLTFDSSLFGYSSDFTVVPNDTGQACRVSYVAGESGALRVDKLELRVVDNST